MAQISFGTDGWRGIIAGDFTFDNVKLVSRAVARYIHAHGLSSRGLVVGYDNRFLSERFAQTVCEILNEEEINVYMLAKATPTPVVAYAIKLYNAGGAVMITASHNPPEYNGFKFIPEYAGPALPHITKEIETNIHFFQHQKGNAQQEAGLHKKRGRKIEVDPRADYFKHLMNLVDLEVVGRAGLKVAVDPMYGSGSGYLEDILEGARAQVQVIHNHRDPLFGGMLPDPTAQSLEKLRSLVLESGADLGLALDGDADRFGIIDRDGSYIPANQFLPLLFHHLLIARGMKGPVVRTVATTHLLDYISRQFDLQVYETPVGFKYVGQHLMEKECVLGGEESGGLSIRGHIPEKDGILADLLAVEITSYHGKSLKKLLEEVWTRYGRLYSERLDIHTSPERKPHILSILENLAPSTLAGLKVNRLVTIDGTKIILEDGSWILIRPSGTEPLFRIYVEATKPEVLKRLQEWSRSIIA